MAVFDRFLWFLTYLVPRCDVSLLIYRNFAAIAEPVGVCGIRLEDPTEVEPGIATALAHDGPVLVDAAVNRSELVILPAITAEMAKDFRLLGEGLHELAL